jgi:hypothetical protein
MPVRKPCSYGCKPLRGRILAYLFLHRPSNIAVEDISSMVSGTNLDIAATDQIRPIAITMTSPMIPMRICIPSVEPGRASHTFRRPDVRWFTIAHLQPLNREKNPSGR